MSNVSTKSLILSQPKVSQTETISAPTLPFTSVTFDNYTETKVEIPGVDPSEVCVDFEAGALSVECARGVLVVPLDSTVDPSKIKADIQWGMLTLTVPLPDIPASRSIKVSVHDVPKKTSTKFTVEE